MASFTNFLVCRDTTDNSVNCLCRYEDCEEVLYDAASFYAYSDCDDSCEIMMIVADGIPLRYVGWKPGMRFEFVNTDTNEVAAVRYYPDLEH